MRSARGYLDTLVRSARPATAAGVHVVRRPDWGPTRLPEDAAEPETSEPGPPRPVTQPARPTARPPQKAHQETTEATTPRPVQLSAPRPPSTPSPVVVTRVEHVSRHEQVTARPPADPAEARETRRPPAPVAPVARHDRAPATPSQAREIVSMGLPRRSDSTEAALERLEHLARRFSATRPAATDHAEPVAPAPRRDEVRAEQAPRRGTEPGPVPLEVPSTPVPPPPEPSRVEIGSIEVFVMQPPSPAPAAAPLAPPRVVVAEPARPQRLSRPLRPYGFGQG